MNLLYWDIYEIRSSMPLQGMMSRGRLRKFANQQQINFLVENDEEGEGEFGWWILNQISLLEVIESCIMGGYEAG